MGERGDPLGASKLCESLNDYEAAAEWAEKADDFRAAARLWSEAGALLRCAEARLKNGEATVAAELFEHVGEIERAAKVHEESGDLLRAAHLWTQRGERKRAADLLVQAVVGERGNKVLGAEMAEVCRRAGALYAELGYLQQATKVLQWGRQDRFAGQLLARAGRVDEAIEVLERAGDFLGAADLARQQGDELRANALLAARAESEGRLVEAAVHFEQAGMYARAAQLFEYAGEQRRAAEASERAGQFEVAAGLYESSGELEAAARCLQAAGRNTAAESLYARLEEKDSLIQARAEKGEHLEAARSLLVHARSSGSEARYEEAVALLCEIGAAHTDFIAARTLVAEIRAEQGRMEDALAALNEVLHGVEPAAPHLPALYQYARLMEREGMLIEARKAYEAIVGIDAAFKDVQERVSLLGEAAGPDRQLQGALSAPVPFTAIAPPTRAESMVLDLARGQMKVGATPAPAKGPVIGMDRLTGTVLRGRFRVEEKIGRGAQAEVYRARDQVLDRAVAIKVLRSAIAADEIAQERFLHEARLAAKVHHRSCMTVFDFGRERGVTFIAMEYFPGITLKERLKQGPIGLRAALLVIRKLADALQAVHDVGIVHRDVKPTNVMIDADGRVRLADFGVAQYAGDDSSSTGVMVGTMKYMAPEQARGKEPDPRADVFSLGVVLYEILAGKPPFGGTLDALIARVSKPAPELPEALGVPEAVRALVRGCLERKPRRRTPSMTAVVQAINAILDDPEMRLGPDLPAQAWSGVDRTEAPTVRRPALAL